MSGSIGIIMAIGVSSLLGWFLILGLLFSIQDLDSTLASGTGQPVTQIFLDTVGEKGAIVLMVNINSTNKFLANDYIIYRSSSLARCTSAGTSLQIRRTWTLATYIFLYIARFLLPRTLEWCTPSRVMAVSPDTNSLPKSTASGNRPFELVCHRSEPVILSTSLIPFFQSMARVHSQLHSRSTKFR